MASNDVGKIIYEIIVKYGLDRKSKITYNVDSEVAYSYLSKITAVDIDNDGAPVHLFIKCPLYARPRSAESMLNTEIAFYDEVYPAYEKFWKDRGVKDGFRNVPKHYAITQEYGLVLENLSRKGYTLFGGMIMNEDHITVVLRAFAKFHAISFAYKDQDKENYELIVDSVLEFIDPELMKTVASGIRTMLRGMISDCQAQWDPVEDKEILSRTGNLAENLVRQMDYLYKLENKYNVVMKGDCWLKNMMFLYEGENKETPIDVMLIDWQTVKRGSPVLDLCYFFYSVASKEALSNLNYYLKVYYEELASQIRQLGSDPDILFPCSALEEEWKLHSKYGYVVAFMIIKAMLITKQEAHGLDEQDLSGIDIRETVRLKNDKEYVNRMKILTEHMIENNFLNFDV